MMKFNEKLDCKIQESGLSQAELSLKAGLSKAIISQVVNGARKNIRPRTISRLCRALNCNSQDIFENGGAK